MVLTDFEVRARSRTPWEAVDLGFALARQWFVSLWLRWCCTAIPIYVVLILCFGFYSYWPAMLLWWFKPIYETPMLRWVSQRVFGTDLTIRQCIRNVAYKDLAAWLTLRRFSPARSFAMPVSILEGQQGTARRARLQTLQSGATTPVWLTVVCIHFEYIFALGLIAFAYVLIPSELEWLRWQDLVAQERGLFVWLNHLATFLSMSVIAPFYVAAGFALYLNRRIDLEAWDIELMFRQLAMKASSSLGRRQALASLACVALLTHAACPTVAAQDPREQARDIVASVYETSTFGELRTRYQWVYTGMPKNIDSEPAWLEELALLLDSLAPTLALAIRVTLAIAIVALLLWLLLSLRNYLAWWSALRGRRKKEPAQERILGAAVNTEPLPADIASAAQACVDANEYRAALSLLFRGALVHLVGEHGLVIPAGASEQECATIVQAERPHDEAVYFARLSSAWLAQAYAHTVTPESVLRELCRRYRTHFSNA